jgi:hypothetical protein
MSDTRERAPLTFGEFAPKPKKIESNNVEIAKEIAKKAGFTSRHSSDESTKATDSNRIDGRSLRATGRKEQLNLSVTLEFKNRFWKMAQAENITVGEELITMLMDYYEHHKNIS